MSGLRILAPGALASLQDGGRHGWRHLGIPRAGALDPALLRLANALVGNPPQAAAIECFDGGLRVRAEDGPVRVALAGYARLANAAGRPLAPWRSHTLAEGDELRVVAVEDGRVAVLAVAGLQLPPVLGACATYARAGLGGLAGRNLAAGDVLPAGLPEGPERHLPHPPQPRGEQAPLRLVPGPQADHFLPEALATLCGAGYQVSAEADRMGLRLAGPALVHDPARGAEILSDATVPGSIQVPGNGQPIVLLADGQTAGGYPKIATVISADLPWLATRRPGTPLRFQAVDVDAAEAAARQREAELRAQLAAIRPLLGDGEALAALNLIGGVVSAHGDPAETLAWMEWS